MLIAINRSTVDMAIAAFDCSFHRLGNFGAAIAIRSKGSQAHHGNAGTRI